MELINKPFTDICLGDVRIKDFDNPSTSSINFEMFDDYDGKRDIVSRGVKLWPGHANNGGCNYMYTRQHDKVTEFKGFFPPDIAKRARLIYKEYKYNVARLYSLYFDGIESKKVSPLYYIDDTHLNVNLNEGDLIFKIDKYTSNISILELKNVPEYNYTIENDIAQESLFYDWLTETGKKYCVRLHGHHFSIGKNNIELLSIPNTSETFQIGGTENEAYLIKNINVDWLENRIINITKKFYDDMYTILGQEPPLYIIKHHNGKQYDKWECEGDLIDAYKDNDKINRHEYVVG